MPHGDRAMQYTIGQIIYVLSSNATTVLPGIVTEETRHKSLNGEMTTYKIAIGPAGKQKIVDLSRVDGEVYGSLGEIREVISARLTGFLDSLLEETSQRVNLWYGDQNTPLNGQGAAPNTERIDPGALLNEVGMHNGNITGLGTGNVSNRFQDDANSKEVVMPDGTIRKVTLNLTGQPQ